MEYGGRTSKWEEGAPTPELLGVFIHQSGGNLGREERGVANMLILEMNFRVIVDPCCPQYVANTIFQII